MFTDLHSENKPRHSGAVMQSPAALIDLFVSTYSLFAYILASRFRSTAWSTAGQKMHDYLSHIWSHIKAMWNDSQRNF
jgi:hypothetical protein